MLFGLSKKWSSGAAGLPLQTIISNGLANPLIILDEIEKSGSNERNGNIRNALLPYLETSTAKIIYENYIEAPVNLSAINWLMTANDIEPLPQPLKNRLRILHCAEPSVEHMPIIAQNLLKAEYHDRGYNENWIEPLNQQELDAIAMHWLNQGKRRIGETRKTTGSIRDLKRHVSAVITAREKAMARA